MDDYDYCFKLIVIGDSAVGKSSFLSRYADHEFTQSTMPTIGVDFKVKTIDIEPDKKVVKLMCHDTSGQERFKSITASYYHGAHGIILMYDITESITFRNILTWLKEIDKYGQPGTPMLLVANKCDLLKRREVTPEDGKELANQYGMAYFESSARDNVNVDVVFTTLVKEIIPLHIKKYPNKSDKKPLDLKTEYPSASSKCWC